jgi:hypothetical protein
MEVGPVHEHNIAADNSAANDEESTKEHEDASKGVYESESKGVSHDKQETIPC